MCRLLEIKLVEMEGKEQGTGSLEDDERLLAAHARAVQQQPGASSQGWLPFRRLCAVVYRAGQKRVVRAHLVGARQELKEVMALLARAQDAQADLSRASQAQGAK